MYRQIHDFDQAREEESALEEHEEEASEDDCSFVLGTTPAHVTSPLTHPPSDRLLQLWQIFIDNVDPLTKIVHVPTIQPAVERASNDTQSVPKAFEALLFAIYSAAVMSLKDSECRRRFGESRKSLLTSYTSSTRTALSRARFMKTSNIVVLQALVIYLMAVREIYEPRLIWILTGVALRIAEGMGLQRDGTSLGLPPFETEIRRRIWWQVKMHDFRTAELSGVAKFQGMAAGPHPPKPIVNLNDHEIYPGMTTPPVESTGVTDMVFCVLRSQLGTFAAAHAEKFVHHGGSGALWSDYAPARETGQKDALVDGLKDVFELKYLRHCDPSEPLQLMTMLFARSANHVGHFMSHHPRRWTTIELIPESEQAYVWDLAIKILNVHEMMQSDRRLKCFAWYAAYYTQWHAFIHVLDTLRAKPLMKGADKAWQLVEATYENNPTWISNTKRPIYVAVGNLCLKAFNARDVVLVKRGDSPPAPPQFIMELRYQREAAKTRRQESETKRKSNHRPVVAREPPNAMGPCSDNAFAGWPGGSGTRPHPPLHPHDGPHAPKDLPNASDAFWYGGGYDDTVLNQFDDPMMMMDVDMDYNYMQDSDQSQRYEDANTAEQGISWSQWDAWLANSGMSLADANYGMDFEPALA